MGKTGFVSTVLSLAALVVAAIALINVGKIANQIKAVERQPTPGPVAAPPAHSQVIDIHTDLTGKCIVVPQQPALHPNENLYFHADDNHVYYVYTNATVCGTPANAIRTPDSNTSNGNSKDVGPFPTSTDMFLRFVVCNDKTPSKACGGSGSGSSPTIGIRIRP